MRARYLPGLPAGLVLASLSVALVGFAQTRATGKGHGQRKPADPSSASGGSGNANANAGLSADGGSSSSSSASNASSASNTDGGAMTAAPSTTASWPQIYDGGARLSPLTPAPEEHPVVVSAPPPPDYDKTIAEIALLRARVAAVSDSLFRSRLALTVQLDSDRQKLDKLSVALDDGAVWEAPSGFRADDPIAVYDHAVAPGRHAITLHVERKDSRDPSFTTEQSSRFVVDVPKDERLEVGVRLEEDSSMGGSFTADKHGDYDLRVRVKASSKPAPR